jgi:serine protease Do
MKSKFPRHLALIAGALALASAAPALRAADEKAAPPKRAPLKLAIDRKPINRDAPDRVSYAPVIKKTAASVVYVYSTKKVQISNLAPFLNDPALRRYFDNLPGRDGSGGGSGEMVPRRNRNRDNSDGGNGSGGNRNSGKSATPRIPEQTQRGLGSGVVISADGYILTNNHVVEGADEVKVSIGEATKRYDATVVGRDAFADIAVLKIEATGLTPATFGDSEQLQVGDVVLAIGNPFGVGQSVSRGIVSAVGRGPGLEANRLEDYIQTDAAINPGNSGGALLDSDGRVIGINTAIISGSSGFAGVGFAIPINLVRASAEQIVNTGRVDRGFLGVSPQDLNEDLTAQFKADKGALLSDVSADSPAEKAGLKPGDVITKVNGVEIRDARHLLLSVSQLAPDSKVTIDYLRDGKPATTTATLGRRTDEASATEQAAPAKDVGVLNGVGVTDITPQLREQFDIPASIKGAIITNVEADSPSARQGLREGDVIRELDRRPVKDANEAVKLSEEIKGPKVSVLVWRQGRSTFLVIDESK